MIVSEPDHHLYVALRLHVGAHHAETHEGLIALRRKRRDDCMEWTFAWPYLVGMSGRKYKTRTAILHRDARVRHHHTGAETHVVRLDVRNHPPVRIGGFEIHGAGLRGRTMSEYLRTLGIDSLGTLLQVIRIQHICARYSHRFGI